MKTLKLTNPLFAPVALPYSTGPLAAPERHQQPEQRHYAGAVTQATVDDLYAAVGTAYAVYQASRVATDALGASASDLEWRAAWDARERALTAWLGAQRVWSTALLARHDVSLPLTLNGPRAQPEQRHMARAMCGEVRSRVVERHTQPEQQQAQLMVVAPEWDVPVLALPPVMTVEMARAGWWEHHARAQVATDLETVKAELRECARYRDLEAELMAGAGL